MLVRRLWLVGQVINYGIMWLLLFPYVCVSCLCMVFLLGFGSCLLHVQVREKKRWSPELESLRGDVYMDSWPARCGDRVDRDLVVFSCFVACATGTVV